eukprot:364759-Chlamydomonas_euryale.AAC.26
MVERVVELASLEGLLARNLDALLSHRRCLAGPLNVLLQREDPALQALDVRRHLRRHTTGMWQELAFPSRHIPKRAAASRNPEHLAVCCHCEHPAACPYPWAPSVSPYLRHLADCRHPELPSACRAPKYLAVHQKLGLQDQTPQAATGGQTRRAERHGATTGKMASRRHRLCCFCAAVDLLHSHIYFHWDGVDIATRAQSDRVDMATRAQSDRGTHMQWHAHAMRLTCYRTPTRQHTHSLGIHGRHAHAVQCPCRGSPMPCLSHALSRRPKVAVPTPGWAHSARAARAASSSTSPSWTACGRCDACAPSSQASHGVSSDTASRHCSRSRNLPAPPISRARTKSPRLVSPAQAQSHAFASRHAGICACAASHLIDRRVLRVPHRTLLCLPLCTQLHVPTARCCACPSICSCMCPTARCCAYPTPYAAGCAPPHVAAHALPHAAACAPDAVARPIMQHARKLNRVQHTRILCLPLDAVTVFRV